MKRSLISRTEFHQKLMVAMSSIFIVSCASKKPEVEINIDSENKFSLVLKNKSKEEFVFDNRLFGRGIDNAVELEVIDEYGVTVPPCGYLDYVGTGGSVSVDPGDKAVISVQVSAITLTRCLNDGGTYAIRAFLHSEVGVVSRTDFVYFQAESPVSREQ